jgi:hypothetical protein
MPYRVGEIQLKVYRGPFRNRTCHFAHNPKKKSVREDAPGVEFRSSVECQSIYQVDHIPPAQISRQRHHFTVKDADTFVP